MIYTLGAIDPIAFRLGDFITVYWYGVILGSAAIFGLLLALWESKRIGFNADLLIDLLIFAVPAAIIGARAYYVLFQWEYYSANPYKYSCSCICNKKRQQHIQAINA